MRPAREPRPDRKGERPDASKSSVEAAAVRLLARRDYARCELRRRLARRGFEADEIERALDGLERLGYLSDERFAQAVVARRAGQYGRRAIAHELREKGVAPAAAESALATLDDSDELAQALALWRRKFGTVAANNREKARQARFLLARGYSDAIAYKVLRVAAAHSE